MKLADYLQLTDTKVPDFAREIGISEDAVRLYLNGQRIPKKEIMHKIMTATRRAVGPADFYGEPENGNEDNNLLTRTDVLTGEGGDAA